MKFITSGIAQNVTMPALWSDIEIYFYYQKKHKTELWSIMQKWNVKTHKYETYDPDWPITLIAEFDEKINCSGCGRRVVYGECYTSLEIHNLMGFGVAVCENCYNEEWKRKHGD